MSHDLRRPVLVLNAGSSSLKFALFGLLDGGTAPVRRLSGQIANIGRGAVFSVRFDSGKDDGAAAPDCGGVATHDDALEVLFSWLEANDLPLSHFVGIGHRVVHGGADFTRPTVVTAEIFDTLSTLSPLAPHHMPHNLGAIAACRRQAPDLPQVACFDTAFHADQPDLEKRLPLPQRYWDAGIRRYGFHGLSYEHIVHAFAEVTGSALPARLVVFHLGNGASACAIKDGHCAGTTMGFSTVDGLIMGTRSGAIDPGVLIHLMRNEGFDAERMEDLLYNQSGLLGLSGISADMRDLLGSERPEAAFAVEKYCLAAARMAAALLPLSGGLDGIVFTGGIGENAAAVRKGIIDRLAWLGLTLDEDANDASATTLANPGSRAGIWIMPANEELTIARHTLALLSGAAGNG